MLKKIFKLREKIDYIDNQLFNLLIKRIKLVVEVFKIKVQQGIPVYTPDRENFILKNCRRKAKKYGVSPDLIEGVFRKIIRKCNIRNKN